MPPIRLDRNDRIWITVLIGINLLVLVNATLHDPRVGYDAADHLKYVETLSGLRLPQLKDSMEFFSPPLPYAAPALFRATGAVTLWGAGKTAQILNVLYALGLTLAMVAICERIRPGNPRLKTSALLCLGMLPVHYKSFSYVRGEPLLAFLVILAAWLVCRWMLADAPAPSSRPRVWLMVGATLGMVLLTRQWGVFLLPAIVGFAGLLVLRGRRPLWRTAGDLMVVFLIGATLSVWFYLFLRQTSGSMKAFNRPASPSFTLANLPDGFLSGLGGQALFTEPLRPILNTQLAPILYSELWGDYWTAFLVRGVDTRDGSYMFGGALHLARTQDPPPDWLTTNRESMARYLGRVNLVSLAPTALLLAGFGFGAFLTGRYLLRGLVRAASPPSEDAMAVSTLLFLIVAATVAGYGWFLVMYPRADTIKATYLLQIFPPLAILSGELLARLGDRSERAYRAIMLVLGLALLHNLPAMVTRFPIW